ncbi:hypothetical protein PSN45_003366 [Yamadazyma tenuis]|uniref:cAMP-dependent protein kinase regulatory subunit n=1 Tax=Candida tenuis (strain ATCC 10573 / BCRC 21748 / CBS 615 / JCM 9827 / NBRC 10315 / NRRL Y-1498 / VKM Y-70) TaxID=590646 RepID=G3AYE5_CANTC|nr:uncharacterized protein CANTEDRAFT_112695 [Yamadazyma tenuis ATCC 10573]XP_006684773.1 camp-dependent protein kinase regulatory subunit [Yamadazyma tenuis ATCC 10573]EGV66198.1 hypothetical protein CANTEDRAFT_112695 [Yamadazyma tenuis ATCC 10573]EGV66199.1 camp-dependent protein kinase regulatory subunit [Yamadazyma tenuis ATCC 10573]WEJ95838.1 hypothetical protein PSN45_003366 [Yamadazyma tenuis]
MNNQKLVTDELNQLQKEIIAKNPVDVLQFCANYFNSKLELQRSYLWQQQARAKAAGLNLFPNIDNVSLMSNSHVNGRQPSFKSPFNANENDPHQLFKDDYSANHSTNENHLPELDPNDPSPAFTDPNDPNAPLPADLEESRDKPRPLTNTKIPIKFNVNRRTSVSAEALNPDKFKTDSWKPPTNNLTESQKTELGKTLHSNFLFQKLDSTSKKTVLSALTKKTYKKGDEIITQGDEGDYFYIIESGTVEFYVDNIERGTSKEGSSFGELALMHNSPRAATVIAASDDVTCWALDRLTFRRILLEGTFNKRLMYENFLKEVKILSGLSTQEISKLADALTTEIYHQGDKIVTEGESGENFYFIESGNCEVFKSDQGRVTELSKGDYFGEVALLNNLPRQATVQAVDTVIVATLDKSGFQRLLGPAVDVLKSNDPTHH